MINCRGELRLRFAVNCSCLQWADFFGQVGKPVSFERLYPEEPPGWEKAGTYNRENFFVPAANRAGRDSAIQMRAV